MSYVRSSSSPSMVLSMDVSALAGVLLALLVMMLVIQPDTSIVRPGISDMGECYGGDDDYCRVSWRTVIIPASGKPYLADEPDVAMAPWDTLAERVRPGKSGTVVGWLVKPADGARVEAVVDAIHHLRAQQSGPVALTGETP